MRTVPIRGEITAEHVRTLWDAVATAEDGEELGIVLDNCTGAQPWVMYAAHYAVYQYNAGAVQIVVRGECQSAALQLLTAPSGYVQSHRLSLPGARFLPHGVPAGATGGLRRNRWQANQIESGADVNLGVLAWEALLASGDVTLPAEVVLAFGLIDEIGPPPDWAVPLLEDGGEAA